MQNNGKKNEIDTLKETGLFLIVCLQECALVEGKDKNFFESTIRYQKKIIADLVGNGDTKGLRYLIKEIELWILHLGINEITAINKKVFEKYGKFIGEDTFFKKTISIVKRGKIKNLKEYNLLLGILELYSGNIKRKELLDSIANLVAEYESEIMRR